MNRRIQICVLTGLVLAVLAADAALQAAPPSNVTVMTVGEMCGGCVKKINGKLGPMEGIAKVECDIKTKTVRVIPKQGTTLSAKVLWEAMEQIGKKPLKMTHPSGTFTSKPTA